MSQIIRLRDSGEYSARNSSKGALIAEATSAVAALVDGASISETRVRAFDGNIFPQRARSTRERIWKSLYQRYFVHDIQWVADDLIKAYSIGFHSQELVSMLYLHYALRDRLVFDFVTDFLWSRWQDKYLVVTTDDIKNLLDQAAPLQPQIERWSQNTRDHLCSSIIAALRDFGVLTGTQKKRLQRPMLPLFTAEHILRILITEGLRGMDIIRDSTWRLFFYHEHEVSDILGKLSQQRIIRFERVGNTVVLETPPEWEEDF
jgi:hypothetical protein